MTKKIICTLLFVPLIVLGQQYNYPFQNPSLDAEIRVNDLLSRLTLQEKVTQMQDVAPAIERLGIPEYNWWNECLHGVARAGAATSFPQAIGMTASWNPQLMYKVADAISTEARAKFNRSIRLGQRNRYQGLTMWTPNINIFRDPRWGRGQETYGEDPYLTSQMGVAFVKGLQGNDLNYFKVIATPKHFAVHSGPEYNRHSFDAYTNKKDLYETYLPAFKDAVVRGKAYSIMSAYNRYLGASATASKFLLNDVLREQWGFKGYVVSDCGAVADIFKTHKIVQTAEEASALAVKAGCDLNCGSTYSYLVEAVTKNLITETEIDTALKRLLTARLKLGLFNPAGQMPFSDISEQSIESEIHQQLALKMARESIVLLKNENRTLPISKKIKRISVIGPNANDRHFMLGNYFGTPTHTQTILEGIQEKVSNKTTVHYFKGTNLTNTDTIFNIIGTNFFKGSIAVSYYDNSNFEGQPVATAQVNTIDFEWGGAPPLDILKPGDFSVRYKGEITADFTGNISLGVMESGGAFKLYVDGQEVLNGSEGNGTQVLSKQLELVKGHTYTIDVEYKCTNEWMASIQLLWDIEHIKGQEFMLQTVAESDVVVFVGGITARLEGEEMPVDIDGFSKGDRTHLKLPKPQSELLKKLQKQGKPVVFVLTSGSAMAINWEQKNLPAILNIWYPGQAGGQALADVLFGDYNPSGKLPVTFYKSVNDLPPFEDYHMDGRTYRYFYGNVLYPFGYGLSYSHFVYSKPRLLKGVMKKDELNTVEVTVANTGSFNGSTVVQLYVKDVEASVSAPLKSLKAFRKIFLKKGETKTVKFQISTQELTIINNAGKAIVEPGNFEIFVGGSSATTNQCMLKVE